MTDWIPANEAAPLLAMMPTQLAYCRHTGLLKHTKKSGPNSRDPLLYDRAEVEALRATRIANGEQADDLTDIALGSTHVRLLAYIDHHDGEVVGESLTPVIAERVGVNRSTLGNVVRDVWCLGFVTKDSGGGHLTRLTLTEGGHSWIAKHRGRIDNVYLPTTAPSPDTVALAVQAVEVPGVRPGPAAPPPAPEVEAPLPDRFTADVIAASMLRQAAHAIADSDLSGLRGERDALRSHVEALTARLDQVTGERERAEAENRELRGLMHGIEVELTPLLVGRDAQFDYLDPTTRAELLRVVGDAARWATAS